MLLQMTHKMIHGSNYTFINVEFNIKKCITWQNNLALGKQAWDTFFYKIKATKFNTPMKTK